MKGYRRKMQIVGFVMCAAAALGGASNPAGEILQAAGVKGGLIVHIGCGDGRLTAALCASDQYVVHGLDADAKNVAASRQHIQSLGLYGKVAVEQWTGPRLPYADNLVNLVVSENLGEIPTSEVLRVLVPNGVAYVKQGGAWTKTVKPRPATIDEWTHFLHDASNNAVARDSVVGPPRSVQWTAGPLWLRSHETPSGFEAMVIGGGRVFYLLDEGIIGITDQRLPERWALICRDAFNGKLLWRRPVEPWGWPQWAVEKFQGIDWTVIRGGRTVVPDENQRRLVADGDRLYATLGYQSPLSILEAATGRTLATVEGTSPVRQIVANDGIVVVYSEPPEASVLKRRGKEAEASPNCLIAIRGATGDVLWRKNVPSINDTMLAIHSGQVVYLSGGKITALDLKTSDEVWHTQLIEPSVRTMVLCDGVVVTRGAQTLEAHDATNGGMLWFRTGIQVGRMAPEDLFIVDGVVWPGVQCVDDAQQPVGRDADNALAVGYDLRTGEEKKRIFVPNLISPEHHHRCYRNRATARYMITSMEGAEFVDLENGRHGQNNFVRGACKMGMVPCNGLLYSPPDQCFCQPGGKVLGFVALGPEPPEPVRPIRDDQRLERGPAYGSIQNPKSKIQNSDDWPTFRHDPARHGSTSARVQNNLREAWRAKITGRLSAPVAVGDRVYVSAIEAQTLYALDLATGKPVWTYVAGGRIDSPPTVEKGLVLFGSADGWVYCLRADDGALVWRFLAAPAHRRIVVDDRIESAWPVHGSVLIRDGIAYVTAGRSTYLDGGIYLYGLEPLTGKVVHRGVLTGPFPDGKEYARDMAFYIPGANSDVLVSEGDAIYMRQKRLTPALQEQSCKVLSSKGESDVGLHVFSTSGLLDGSWYNRAFWMYAKRWPGFQLANQASKSGQLLVVDDQQTYAVNPFYRRNCHSPMFFPGKEGYLLFADANSNEPQIVGDEGARPPVEWLPQSAYMASSGLRTLDSEAFGQDKGIGYTRAEPPVWAVWLPVRIRAMVKTAEALFVAGTPDVLDEKDPYAAFEGRLGARLVAVSPKDGSKISEQPLDTPPVFDGMIAVPGRLLVSLEDGSLLCLQESK